MALSLHQRKKFLFDQQLRQRRRPVLRENPEKAASPTGRWIGQSDIRVECRRGGEGGDIPERFRFDRRTLEISEVKESWLAPDHRYFKVETKEGGEYILRHDKRYDLWEVKAFAEPEDEASSTD